MKDLSLRLRNRQCSLDRIASSGLGCLTCNGHSNSLILVVQFVFISSIYLHIIDATYVYEAGAAEP
jgi:hypothetical protein